MEEKVLIVNKERGQTPLECLNQIKIANPKWAHLPLTYAGRLDPLARGVLVVLIGDECHKKDEYLDLPKEYIVTVLFGFSTDTYDLMGLVTKMKKNKTNESSTSSSSRDIFSDSRTTEEEESDCENLPAGRAIKIREILAKFTGRIKQAYPPYSSRTVLNKPLFKWAREGRLDEITIPSHDVFIERIEMISQKEITGSDLFAKIKDDISRVAGDFRQVEIIASWREILKDEMETKYKTITLKINCHSGVYVRSIAEGIGQALKIPSLALDIVRTKVGDYEIEKLEE